MATKKNTNSNAAVVQLEEPIERGEGEKAQKIESITLRRPNAGELRGTKLTDLLQMDVTAMIGVIPRISEPMLTEADLATMNPADFTNLSLEVVGFLNGKASPL